MSKNTKYLIDFYSSSTDRIVPFKLTLTECDLYKVLKEDHFRTIEEVKNKIKSYKEEYENCAVVEHANHTTFYL